MHTHPQMPPLFFLLSLSFLSRKDRGWVGRERDKDTCRAVAYNTAIKQRQIAWIVPAIVPAGQARVAPCKDPRDSKMLLRRVLSSVSVCPQTAPSRSSICQRPICRPVENHLSWALPCSAHVAVSLMKLVLQHLPSRPSCNTKGHWSIKGLEGIGGRHGEKHTPL